MTFQLYSLSPSIRSVYLPNVFITTESSDRQFEIVAFTVIRNRIFSETDIVYLLLVGLLCTHTSHTHQTLFYLIDTVIDLKTSVMSVSQSNVQTVHKTHQQSYQSKPY